MASKPKQASLWDRGWQWVADSEHKMKVVIGLVAFLSFFVGSVREAAVWAWRHFTGSEVALKLDPQVQALNDIAQRTDARIASTEAQILVQAASLRELTEIKKQEQQEAEVKANVYRDACASGNFSAAGCERLGYAHPEQDEGGG